MLESAYRPIACGLYDELVLCIERRLVVDLVFVNDAGESCQRRARLVDIFSRQKAEFIRLDDDCLIRLDRLLAVSGTSLRCEEADGG